MTETPLQPALTKLLDSTGVTWTRRDVLLAEINTRLSHDNQVRHEPLNADVVDDYAAAMDRGDVFPPVLVAERDGVMWLLGGNHRTAGRAKAGLLTIAAVVVVDPTDDQARLLAFGDNATHGQPLTNAEKLSHADWLIDHGGLSENKASAHIGISQTRVSRHRRVKRSRARLKKIDPNVAQLCNQMSDVSMARIANIESDEVFVELASGIATYAIPAKNVHQIVDEIEAFDHPRAQLESVRHTIEGFALAGKRERHATGARRSETHRLIDLLFELADIDYREAERLIRAKPEDVDIWGDRLKAGARRLYDLNRNIGAGK